MMTMYYILQTFGYTKGPAPIAHAASTLLHWLSFSGASSDPHGPSQIGNSSRPDFLLDDEVESQWNTSIWCTTCSFPGVMIASYFSKRANYIHQCSKRGVYQFKAGISHLLLPTCILWCFWRSLSESLWTEHQ